MKRSNRKRHRPEEVVAKLRQADEALAKGTDLAEVGSVAGGVRGNPAPLASRVRGGGDGRLRAACLPVCGPAPEHAAPHGAAGLVQGQAGGQDAGIGRGEPTYEPTAFASTVHEHSRRASKSKPRSTMRPRF
jgi:hypothetical protein